MRSHRLLARGTAVPVVLLLLAVSIFATLGSGEKTAHAENAPAPWYVTVTPNQNLTDGAQVSINLQTDPTYPIYQAKAQVCRHGVAYANSDSIVPAEDFTTGGANCPSIPISSSADLVSADGDTFSTAVLPGGETFVTHVGAGVAQWNSVIDDSAQSLTCDFQNPCDLVVEVRGADVDLQTRWIPYVQTITYLADDPIAGCGGPADGMLVTGGSDRMGPAWVNLTLDQCKKSGAQHGAASGASLAGEGDAMDNFSRGDLDLAYSAVGYDAAVGLGHGTKSEPLTPRASVSVPIALNATVIAVGNGYRSSTNRKIPYSDVKITLDQATAMFAGGPFQFDAYTTDFEGLNPQFASTGLFSNTSPIKVGAYADAESTSWFMTKFFKDQRPDLWKVPDNNSFSEERGLPRPASASLGVASPSYQNALDLFSGRTLLDKAIRLRGGDEYGGIWVITDYATALLLGMTPVQIENANGVFVGPNAESMAAAVPTMKATDDGRLMPDYSSVPNIDGVQPYPLTYVEYAVAPTQKLVDTKCVERSTSQGLMATWLNYVVGDGQSKLPAGYLPLTDDLKTSAATAIAKVGSSAPTCATTTATTSPGAVEASGDSVAVTPPAAVRRVASASGTPPAAAAAAGAAASTQVLADAELASALADMGSFNDGSATSGLLAIGGLVAVFGLLVISAMATSGKLNLRRRPGK